MALTADEARSIAEAFRNIGIALGDFRFANWDQLSAAQRGELEDDEWTLLNYSSDFTTKAVGLTLDNAKDDLQALLDATKKATDAVSNIKTIEKVFAISGAVLKLGAAVASENPALIVTTADDLYQAASG